MGRARFSDAIFLALTGSYPTEGVSKVVEAVLVSSIDHGATPPSTLAARTAASTGAPLNAAIAAGILTINAHHGGAVEDSMKFFYTAVARCDSEGISVAECAELLAAELKQSRKRAPGYGHRVHTDDPRTPRLMQVAQANGVAGRYCEFSAAFRAALAASTGRDLPLNVDGAIAAVLCDLGLPTEIANAFFIMARVPGLVAHIMEERTREKVMRRISPVDVEYDGPEPSSFEGGDR
jgi:citrate synthase